MFKRKREIKKLQEEVIALHKTLAEVHSTQLWLKHRSANMDYHIGKHLGYVKPDDLLLINQFYDTEINQAIEEYNRLISGDWRYKLYRS